MKVYTNIYLRWPLDDLRNNNDNNNNNNHHNNNKPSKWTLYPPNFKSKRIFILIWHQMTPGWPQTTLEILAKPTKFQIHTKVYTNMTSDGPGWPSKKSTGNFYFTCRPSFIPIQQLLLIRPQKEKKIMQMNYLICIFCDIVDWKSNQLGWVPLCFLPSSYILIGLKVLKVIC